MADQVDFSEYEKIRTWRKEGFTLHLFDCGYDYKQGKNRLGYIFKDGRKTIFSGRDFFTPQAIDSLESVYSLLGFLSLKEGDTDQEYFDSYTPEQIAWRDSSRCDDLAWLVMEWEERNNR